MLKIGLDIGYGYTKAVASNGKEVVFPSLIGEGFDRREYGDIPGAINSNNMHVIIDDQHYFLGRLAVRESDNASYAFDKNKIMHENTKVILASAVAMLMDNYEQDISIVAGLPFSDYAVQKKEFRRYLRDFDIVISLIGTQELKRRVKFRCADVFPQAAGAVFELAEYYNFENNGLIGCIDIGTKTTDVSVFSGDDFTPILSLSGTVEIGAHVIHPYLARNAEAYGLRLDTAVLERVLRNGETVKSEDGQSVDFSKALQMGKRDLAKKIKDEVSKKWTRKLYNFSDIFLVGGGAELLKEENVFNRAIIPDNPAILNARGFLIVADHLAKEVIP